ncbi:MAG: hypothetical protein K2L48_03485 [Mycoplasmoidaceae bacterium]|nr:hypothetical protein [Mycoplasmoidaceae bacterium]
MEYKGSYNLDGTKGVSGASDNKIFHSFLPTNADQTTPIKSNLTPSVDSKQFTSEDIYIQDDYIK